MCLYSAGTNRISISKTVCIKFCVIIQYDILVEKTIRLPYSRSRIEWVQSSVCPKHLSGQWPVPHKSRLICGICERVKGVTAWGKEEVLSACCCKISIFWRVKQKVAAGTSASGDEMFLASFLMRPVAEGDMRWKRPKAFVRMLLMTPRPPPYKMYLFSSFFYSQAGVAGQ